MAKASDKYRNWFDSDKLVSDLMDQAADDIDERDAEIERLREALLGLMKVQNGPPLTAWTNDWLEAMKKADAALQQKESE